MAGMRSVGSGIVSFGLVSIPIKAYLTASSESFSFNMITPDGNRVKQKLVDAITLKDVERADTKKGYEYEKDKFIVFTDEELKQLEGERSNHIEIKEVTNNIKLNPATVEKAYYLAPDKSDKAYRLLVKCLSATKKVAVCKWLTRGRDHLVALAPMGDLLMMFQMYYAHELRKFPFAFSKNSEPSDKEVDLANRLLGQLSSDKFDLESYKDQYAERIKIAIARKQAGETIEVIKDAPVQDAFDLSALLESSLKA